MTDSVEKYSAPALEKGLDILELLAYEPEGVSKSEIARRLDRTISEIFRMLAVLERRDYIVAPNNSDRYTLTLKLFELSHRYPPIRRLGMASNEAMRRLAAAIQQSCHLSVYFSGKAHVVAQQDAPADIIYSVRLGVEVKLWGTCSGHVLLAFADDEQRASMIKEIPIEHSRPSADELETMVRRVRERGYECIESPRTANSTDVGFPVYDHTGSVVASLVVPYLRRIDGLNPTTINDVIAASRTASALISAGLGYSGPE